MVLTFNLITELADPLSFSSATIYSIINRFVWEIREPQQLFLGGDLFVPFLFDKYPLGEIGIHGRFKICTQIWVIGSSPLTGKKNKYLLILGTR